MQQLGTVNVLQSFQELIGDVLHVLRGGGGDGCVRRVENKSRHDHHTSTLPRFTATHNRFQDTRLDDMREIGFHVFEYDVQIPIIVGPHHMFNFDYILMLESLEVADFSKCSLCVNVTAKSL